MELQNPERNDRGYFTNGVKTAAIVVILGTFAAVADQAFFVAPNRSPAPLGDGSVLTAVQPMSPVQPVPQAFAVPTELRANAGEVPAHIDAY